jgi:hypothetical protein
VSYEIVDDTIFHAYTNFSTDVRGYAYRVFERSQVPFDAVQYEMLSYDAVIGQACGSGGHLGFYDFAVEDPLVTWPSWGNETLPTYQVGVPDGGYALS